MQRSGVCRDNNVLLRVLLECAFALRRHWSSKFHITLGVADAGCRAEENRKGELFRDIPGILDEVVRFLNGCRVETGNLRELCIHARVLLVLGTVCEWVVCGKDDKSAFGSGG